jgi:vesicle-fusing ATPase
MGGLFLKMILIFYFEEMSLTVYTKSFACCNAPGDEAALTNYVWFNPEDYSDYHSVSDSRDSKINIYVKLISVKSIKPQMFYILNQHDSISKGKIGMSFLQRKTTEISLREEIQVSLYILGSEKNILLGEITFEIGTRNKSHDTGQSLIVESFKIIISKYFTEQILTIGQEILIEFNGCIYILLIKNLEVAPLDESSTAAVPCFGMLTTSTLIKLTASSKSTLRLIGETGQLASLFQSDWNFEKMGIGGLDKEASDIFRRAFASRILPPAIIQRLGIKHVKGILLYGPPGTGKTLIARQIGKMLNTTSPKICNGPEIFGKYVGESEGNIRALFAEAKDDYQKLGESSPLHIIIFDEIDAICRTRGSSFESPVHDAVVNQLLSEIDGIDAANNVIVIGMTNRKDMLDEALLRPGRLEIHMEIGLPDEKGRLQIFKIHTQKIRDNGFLSFDVNLTDLAAFTKNYTGAEIEGVVKSASSFAISRHIDMSSANPTQKDVESMKIERQDFLLALKEVRPVFGASNDIPKSMKHGIVEYSSQVTEMLTTLMTYINQIQISSWTNQTSICILGQPNSGKTSIAEWISEKCAFPFIRTITPDMFVAHTDIQKANVIVKTFSDAYRSSFSIIILDDLEILIEYIDQYHFCNMVLQAILAFLKKSPPKGHKLLIVATMRSISENLHLNSSFDIIIKAPPVLFGNELKFVFDNVSELMMAETAKSIIDKMEILLIEKYGSEILGKIGFGIKDVWSAIELGLISSSNDADITRIAKLLYEHCLLLD